MKDTGKKMTKTGELPEIFYIEPETLTERVKTKELKYPGLTIFEEILVKTIENS